VSPLAAAQTQHDGGDVHPRLKEVQLSNARIEHGGEREDEDEDARSDDDQPFGEPGTASHDPSTTKRERRLTQVAAKEKEQGRDDEQRHCLSDHATDAADPPAHHQCLDVSDLAPREEKRDSRSGDEGDSEREHWGNSTPKLGFHRSIRASFSPYRLTFA